MSAETAVATPHRDGSLRAAVAVSGVRCVLTYLVIPLLGPVFGLTGGVDRPVVGVLHVVGAAFGLRAMWRAHRTERSGAPLLAAGLVSLNLLGLLT